MGEKIQHILIILCQQMQQRQQQEGKLIGHGRSVFNNAVSPIPAEVQAMVHNVHPNHEMMMRPEAQNIMDGLRHGKLTVQHLVHQLHNQGNNPRIREMLAGVLKVHLQHQQQQARAVSPHVMPQQMRITSPMNGGDPALMHQGELCTRSASKDRVSLVVGAFAGLVPTMGGVLGTSPVPPMQGSSLTVQHSGTGRRSIMSLLISVIFAWRDYFI